MEIVRSHKTNQMNWLTIRDCFSTFELHGKMSGRKMFF